METRENGEREGVRPSGDTAGQCPRTRHGNVPLVLGEKEGPHRSRPLEVSLFSPELKGKMSMSLRSPAWGFCKGLPCSVSTGNTGSGKLTFGKGTILTVHPSKCNRTQQHTGNSGTSPPVSGLREMYVAWEPDLA